MTDTSPEKLKLTFGHGLAADLQLLKVNARFMRHETFQALVDNIRRDGALTQLPFVWHDVETGKRTVLSGNHRVKAAIEAGLTEIDWLETEQPLPEQRRLAIQLSHNAIAGEDDPALLASLYDRLEDIDWRAYSGLDDRQLNLLAEVNVDGLSEANLDYQTLSLVFLPDDFEAAMHGLKEAAEVVTGSKAKYLARYEDHVRILDAVAQAGASHNVRNQAAAVSLVLDIFLRHRTDLADGYLDENGEALLRMPKGRDPWVPLATVFGTDSIPADVAAVLTVAVRKLIASGDVDSENRWRALELVFADFLAGA